MKQDYLDYLEKNFSDHSTMVDSISDANIERLKAIFTYYVRQERFKEGLWGKAAKDKIFLNLLKRLKNITNQFDLNDKKDYLARQLGRTHNKRYENYVITRIWHKLDRVDMKPITQQYVVRPEGYALIDLYFPQIDLFVEVDEGHHQIKRNITADEIRERDVIGITESQFIRIDVTQGLESIHRQVDEVVAKIRKLIERESGIFVPWNMAEEYDPQTYINKGKIALKDNVAFRTCKDACNCFGYKYKNYQRGGAKHPLKDNTSIWFPKLYPHGEWLNEISIDGCTIVEKNTDDKKNSVYVKQWLNDSRNIRIVFAQGKDALGMMRYRFKGVFKLNKEKTASEQSAIWEKISDQVETINPET